MRTSRSEVMCSENNINVSKTWFKIFDCREEREERNRMALGVGKIAHHIFVNTEMH